MSPSARVLVSTMLAAALEGGAPVALVQEPRVAPPVAELRVGMARGGRYEVETLPMEPYVARVLAGEALPDSHPAAFEALAIAIRTYALANLGRHEADGFDVCDQTHCQVLRRATASTERAAQVTAGQVLLDRGAPASIFYSASCGGRTEIPSAVWPGAEDPPFLPSQDDDACGGSPVWTAQIATADLERAFRAAGFRGSLRAFRIASRNDSGRVARLVLDGLNPGEISGQDLRAVVGRTLGWQHIRSTTFELRRVGDAYRFAGQGSGHGVGMCVIGSERLAGRGRSASEILARYFPGLTIGPSVSRATEAPRSTGPGSARLVAADADVLVSLPEGDEGERDAMMALASRARDDLANELGLSPPELVSLRFHPTADAYERATAQPWFTSSAVVRREIHLLPPTVLRDRGVLERAVRHSLVHLMVDPILTGRRSWVREGAALYFADPARAVNDVPELAPRMPGSPQARPSCPDDADLERPASVGALSTAYAAARACFARQLAAGRSWREVR
jgi:SpoIID/LytB domain protein